MAQAYSDPSRESDPHALPDIEIFYNPMRTIENGEEWPVGWYWWSCFPGCLPEGDPIGPFDTEVEALADAQNTGD